LWYLLNPLPHAPGEYLYEVHDQLTYVIPALPQGRYENGKYVQPIVKIAAEFVACNHVGQVAMSGGHKTNVDAMCAAASQSLELLFLQNAQKFRLQGQRQITDFVQEKRAGIGHFEAAHSLCYGPGKGASLVPKQLTLQQIEGNGGAV
jgi:hypothetical protein